MHVHVITLLWILKYLRLKVAENQVDCLQIFSFPSVSLDPIPQAHSQLCRTAFPPLCSHLLWMPQISF